MNPYGQPVPMMMQQQPMMMQPMQPQPMVVQSPFVQGAIIHLTAMSTSKQLRFNGSIMDGKGGRGNKAIWRVHVAGPTWVKFENFAFPGKYLRLNQNGMLDFGMGGPWCVFNWVAHGNNTFSFASTKHPRWHVGIKPCGNMKPGNHTGTGPHGRFLMSFAKPSTQPVMIQQPVYTQPVITQPVPIVTQPVPIVTQPVVVTRPVVINRGPRHHHHHHGHNRSLGERIVRHAVRDVLGGGHHHHGGGHHHGGRHHRGRHHRGRRGRF